jgi:hypothetical protein
VNVLQLIDEVELKVPVGAPFGTRWKSFSAVTTPTDPCDVAVAVRIDAQGRRREQFWCDGVRLDKPVLLRLTCPEAECPHAIQVRAQWQVFHHRGRARPPAKQPGPEPLVWEIPVRVGGQHFTARPAMFPCFTPCPHGAHPPLTIHKAGFDLFDEGACLGGGVVESGGSRQPRIPTVRAAEAFVLARHLETQAALGAACESSRPQSDPRREGG